MYERALKFAKKYHKGQKRRGGKDYITHCIAVADVAEGEEFKVIALLHDILEDTKCTYNILANEFGFFIAEIILTLTKRNNEKYKNYLERISCTMITAIIKMADIKHNLNDNPTKKQKRKYKKALKFIPKCIKKRNKKFDKMFGNGKIYNLLEEGK